jgi:DNA-binding NarL/FixJ family response regulator
VIRVAVIDPQPAVRAGLGLLLRGEPGFVFVGAAAGSEDAFELVRRERPTVVLLDAHLDDGDGYAVCRRLRAEPEGPRVIVYTGGAESEGASEVLCRVAGADGLVSKSAEMETLFEAIRVVARGFTALPPLSREQLDAAAHQVEPDDLALLAMLVDRTSPADMASTLRIDRRRMSRRIERVMGRLRAAPRPTPA